MIRTDRESADAAILQAADLIVTAALTAPKAHGMDDVTAMVVTGEDKDKIAEEMRRFGTEQGQDFMLRDAKNVDASPVVVLFAPKKKTAELGNYCGMCGFKNCGEAMKAGTNCALVLTDLGIAMGSAVSTASALRIDNRVMFSIGKAALNLGLFEGNPSAAFGLPLSINSKSIYMDRG